MHSILLLHGHNVYPLIQYREQITRLPAMSIVFGKNLPCLCRQRDIDASHAFSDGNRSTALPRYWQASGWPYPQTRYHRTNREKTNTSWANCSIALPCEQSAAMIFITSVLFKARFGVRVLNLLILYSLNGFFSLADNLGSDCTIEYRPQGPHLETQGCLLVPFDRIQLSKAFRKASSICPNA